MPLSEDQKAMLRLLAQREQGYDDLAALMGLSVDEVRAKVKDALAQLEREGEAPPPVPEEPASPEPPAPQPEPVAEPVRPAAPVPPPEPKPPAQPDPPVAAASKPAEPAKSASPSRPRPALPQSSGARAAIAAGLAVIALVIVVLVVGGGSDNSGDTTTASSDTTSGSEETAASNTASSKLTQAVLSAVDGSAAQGLASFGRVKNSLALQIEAEGLKPTGKGQSYTVWLYESPQKMLPLATTAVGKSGKIGAQVQVPTEVLAYLAKETFDQVDVSLTSDAALKASLAKATREKEAPAYTGTDVLRGRITGPIIGAANKAGE
jgi:hypothetical protein